MKHAYRPDCSCARCERERQRRARQADTAPRPAPILRNARRSSRQLRADDAYMDAFLSGRPMSADDY